MSNTLVHAVVFLDLPPGRLVLPANGEAQAGRLADAQISIVLCSHRTRAEVETISQRWRFRHPFVVENGAAAFVPRGYFPVAVAGVSTASGYDVLEFAKPYSYAAGVLRHVADRLHVPIRTFAEMSVEEVAAAFGISLLEARLAKLREYSEAFTVADGNERSRARLRDALAAAHLTCTMSRSFDYASAVRDWTAAVDRVASCYRAALGELSIHRIDGRLLEGNADWIERLTHAVRRWRQGAPWMLGDPLEAGAHLRPPR